MSSSPSYFSLGTSEAASSFGCSRARPWPQREGEREAAIAGVAADPTSLPSDAEGARGGDGGAFKGRGAGRARSAGGAARPEHALRCAGRRSLAGGTAALPRQPRPQPASPSPAPALPPRGAVVAAAEP